MVQTNYVGSCLRYSLSVLTFTFEPSSWNQFFPFFQWERFLPISFSALNIVVLSANSICSNLQLRNFFYHLQHVFLIRGGTAMFYFSSSIFCTFVKMREAIQQNWGFPHRAPMDHNPLYCHNMFISKHIVSKTLSSENLVVQFHPCFSGANLKSRNKPMIDYMLLNFIILFFRQLNCFFK